MRIWAKQPHLIPMPMRIKRGFTLLEITLALSLLVLIASLTGVNIKRLVDTHRFEKQISDLFLSLQEAQVLSAAYHTDFALDIETEQGQLTYRFSTDEPFLEHRFSQERTVLSSGCRMKWNEHSVSRLHCSIYAGGRIDPAGILGFTPSQEEDARVLYLDLQRGYLIKFCYTRPAVIHRVTDLQKPMKT